MKTAAPSEQELAADRQAAIDLAETVKEVRTRATELTRRVTKTSKRIEEMRDELTPERIDEGIADLEAALVELDGIRDEQYALVAAALSWRHSPDEVRSWCERCMAAGAPHPRIDGRLLEDLIYERRVPNAPVREAYLALRDAERPVRYRQRVEDLYCAEDYREQCNRALGTEDYTLLEKKLGLKVRPNGKGVLVSMFMDYDEVSKLAPILNVMPRLAGV